MAHPATQDDIKKLAELIKDVRISMMTTVEPDGTLRSRPMATQEGEFDGDLWFFTNADAPKVDEIEQERNVGISYANADKNVWVSVSGTATLVRDPAKKDELWNPMNKAWFPNGKDDPNVALLKVRVTSAEYWDAQGNKVSHLVGFVKAVVTGKSYEPGENEKLDLAGASSLS